LYKLCGAFSEGELDMKKWIIWVIAVVIAILFITTLILNFTSRNRVCYSDNDCVPHDFCCGSWTCLHKDAPKVKCAMACNYPFNDEPPISCECSLFKCKPVE
jgi:hypothetical protein